MKGQSLIEVIIGVTVAGVFILGASNLLNISNIGTSRSKEYQTATFLAQELIENISVYADSKWYCAPGSCFATRGIYNLGKGASNPYYLAGTPFEWRSGEEDILISNLNYRRYFFVENICRNADNSIAGAQSGVCVEPTFEDPSMQKVTVVVKWAIGGNNYDLKLEKHIARTRNTSVVQTDWNGGGGQSGLFLDVTRYDLASGISDLIKGKIKIDGY